MADKINRDSITNTLTVAIGLSLVCSILVASAAVALKPIQERNAELYRQRIILEVAGLMTEGADVGALFAAVDSTRVETGSGDSHEVYLVTENNAVKQIILPIEGAGLWSTMRGYLALQPDGNTIAGLRFYEHGETPGLGDQIDNDAWRQQWAGKRLFDQEGSARIEVVKGFVVAGSASDQHQIDGLSGATLTGNGVTKLVRYWIGSEGFGPYLEQLSLEQYGDQP